MTPLISVEFFPAIPRFCEEVGVVNHKDTKSTKNFSLFVPFVSLWLTGYLNVTDTS